MSNPNSGYVNVHIVLQHREQADLNDAIKELIGVLGLTHWRETWLCEEFVPVTGVAHWLWQVTVNSL